MIIKKNIRRALMSVNNFFGKLFGIKLQKVPYSRPSTLLVRKIYKENPVSIIEIGCAAGHNASDIFNSLNVKEFIAIDPYETAATDYNDYTRDRLVYMRKKAESQLKKFNHIIDWKKMLSDQAILEISGSYDFIYIDGDHSFSAVYQDIKNYYPLLKNGGVIAGHDIDQQPVLEAFFKFISENNIKKFSIKDPDWIIIK
jgi:predicted O-methyltransferase YrrM